MRTIIFLLALTASAHGSVVNKVECHSTVNDGGYAVNIHYVNRSLLLAADIYENSFFGRKLLATVLVDKLNQIDGVEYRDSSTKGKTLLLTIDFNKESEENYYQGYVRGNLNGSAIPPQELPEFGALSCLVK